MEKSDSTSSVYEPRVIQAEISQKVPIDNLLIHDNNTSTKRPRVAPRIPKTPTERGREYRKRQKLLKISELPISSPPRGRPGWKVGDEAREVIYKVYLYFIEEANRFLKSEDGYFQKVQKRVAEATGVSHRFVQRLVREKDDIGPRKRKLDASDPRAYDSEVEKPAKTHDVTMETDSTQNAGEPILRPIIYVKPEPIESGCVPIELDPLIKNESTTESDDSDVESD